MQQRPQQITPLHSSVERLELLLRSLGPWLDSQRQQLRVVSFASSHLTQTLRTLRQTTHRATFWIIALIRTILPHLDIRASRTQLDWPFLYRLMTDSTSTRDRRTAPRISRPDRLSAAFTSRGYNHGLRTIKSVPTGNAEEVRPGGISDPAGSKSDGSQTNTFWIQEGPRPGNQPEHSNELR